MFRRRIKSLRPLWIKCHFTAAFNRQERLKFQQESAQLPWNLVDPLRKGGKSTRAGLDKNDSVIWFCCCLSQVQTEEGAGEQIGLHEQLCGERHSGWGSDPGILHPPDPEMDQHQPGGDWEHRPGAGDPEEQGCSQAGEGAVLASRCCGHGGMNPRGIQQQSFVQWLLIGIELDHSVCWWGFLHPEFWVWGWDLLPRLPHSPSLWNAGVWAIRAELGCAKVFL